MKKKYNFNYITTNDINNKQYIGAHSTNNINDDYLGGGKLIGKAIKKYKKENFSRKILCYTKTAKEAFENEAPLIEKYNTLVPNGYNISPTGGLGFVGQFSKETKAKISEALTGRKLSKEHIENSAKGNTGLKRSEETKKKQREAVAKRKYIYNKEFKNEEKRIKEEKLQYYLDNNWILGFSKKHEQKFGDRTRGKTYEELYGEEKAKEIKQKQSEASKDKPKSKIHKQSLSKAAMGKRRIYNKELDKEKAVKEEDLPYYLNIGYKLGKKLSLGNTKGKIRIHNKKFNRNKTIKKEELLYYLDNDWELGMLKRTK